MIKLLKPLSLTILLILFSSITIYPQYNDNIEIGDIEAPTFESFFDSLNTELYKKIEPKNFSFIKTAVFDNDMSGLKYGLKKVEWDAYKIMGDGGKALMDKTIENLPIVTFQGKKNFDQKELFQRLLNQLEEQFGEFTEGNLDTLEALIVEMLGGNLILGHKEKLINGNIYSYKISIVSIMDETTIEIKRLIKIPEF